MNQQVSEALRAVSLPPTDADWMIKRLRTQQGRERQDAERAASGIQVEIDQIDQRIKRLQDAYLA